jgi:hypothetical protein
MPSPIPSMQRSSIFSVKDGFRSDPDIANTTLLISYLLSLSLLRIHTTNFPMPTRTDFLSPARVFDLPSHPVK